MKFTKRNIESPEAPADRAHRLLYNINMKKFYVSAIRPIPLEKASCMSIFTKTSSTLMECSEEFSSRSSRSTPSTPADDLTVLKGSACPSSSTRTSSSCPSAQYSRVKKNPGPFCVTGFSVRLWEVQKAGRKTTFENSGSCRFGGVKSDNDCSSLPTAIWKKFAGHVSSRRPSPSALPRRHLAFGHPAFNQENRSQLLMLNGTKIKLKEKEKPQQMKNII